MHLAKSFILFITVVYNLVHQHLNTPHTAVSTPHTHSYQTPHTRVVHNLTIQNKAKSPSNSRQKIARVVHKSPIQHTAKLSTISYIYQPSKVRTTLRGLYTNYQPTYTMKKLQQVKYLTANTSLVTTQTTKTSLVFNIRPPQKRY